MHREASLVLVGLHGSHRKAGWRRRSTRRGVAAHPIQGPRSVGAREPRRFDGQSECDVGVDHTDAQYRGASALEKPVDDRLRDFWPTRVRLAKQHSGLIDPGETQQLVAVDEHRDVAAELVGGQAPSEASRVKAERPEATRQGLHPLHIASAKERPTLQRHANGLSPCVVAHMRSLTHASA